jgi:Leucine-rich repeat (LRR) protein
MNKILLTLLLNWVMACHAQSALRFEWDSLPVFTSIESAIQQPEQVYRLDLRKQKLSVFPVEILQFSNLIELNLEKNKIDSLPEEISKLSNLQSINLAHNEIYSLPDGIWQLTQIRYLNVADNILSRLSIQIQYCTLLEELVLYDNPLEEYPDQLSDLPNLRVLDLLHNNISYETQDRLMANLPDCKVIMSPPCSCADGQ